MFWTLPGNHFGVSSRWSKTVHWTDGSITLCVFATLTSHVVPTVGDLAPSAFHQQRCCVGLAELLDHCTILVIMVFMSVLCWRAGHTVWTTSGNTCDKLCSKNKSDRVLVDDSSPTRSHRQLPCCQRNKVTQCHKCITYVDICMISSLHEAVPPKIHYDPQTLQSGNHLCD